MTGFGPTLRTWVFAWMGLASSAVLIGAIIVYRQAHRNLVVITPSTFSECSGPKFVTHVQWDMRGTAHGNAVFVSAYRLGMQPTVVGSGPLRGELDTGEWVSDGTTLLLSDDANHVLAKRTIETSDCAMKPIWEDAP